MEFSSGERVAALLTDFGTTDHFAASMKGMILRISPGASIVDITHEISPHDVESAGFILWSCYRDFPENTVFVCVVDPGVGSDRKRLVYRSGDMHFIAPDNGLLSCLFDETDGEAYEISDQRYFRDQVSGTFDGRDIFSPAAAHILNGVRAEQLGPMIGAPYRFATGLEPGSEPAVVHIDRFGNLVTNLRSELLPGIESIMVRGEKISEKRRFFDEGDGSGLFMIAGSSGLIEIAGNRQSASGSTGAKVREKLSVKRVENRISQ